MTIPDIPPRPPLVHGQIIHRLGHPPECSCGGNVSLVPDGKGGQILRCDKCKIEQAI